jgi:hypothetical protein
VTTTWPSPVQALLRTWVQRRDAQAFSNQIFEGITALCAERRFNVHFSISVAMPLILNNFFATANSVGSGRTLVGSGDWTTFCYVTVEEITGQ